ncbi:MAG: response regulator transcription factor [Flavobacterium sp.]|nr:response regulator transcription factor [Flavobacterium sp.]
MKCHTVVIVEDHTLLLQAIAGIVDHFEHFEVSYLCKNGLELLEKFKFQKNIPDIVLMDINMPVMNGIETTKWINDNYPQVKVLALTVEEDEETVLKMLRCGAKGYLLKDVDKKTLEKALEKVMETGFYHSHNITDILMNAVSGKGKTEAHFKETELEFMKLVCTEMTYREIADKMCLSPKTIDGYRDVLFEKLEVKNRIGLVVYAIKHKIFVP